MSRLPQSAVHLDQWRLCRKKIAPTRLFGQYSHHAGWEKRFPRKAHNLETFGFDSRYPTLYEARMSGTAQSRAFRMSDPPSSCARAAFPCAGAADMSLSWLSLLSKLVPFVGSLDDILEAIGAFQSADSSEAYWTAFKRLGDLLQPIVGSVTGFEAIDEAHAIEALRLGDGKILEKLKAFVGSDAGKLLISLLLGQLGK